MDDTKKKTYACPVCGFRYADEEMAKKCEAACRTGKCDSEIQKLAVSRGESEGCEDGVCKLQPKPDLEKKLEEAVNQSLRALADYQNLQKEVAKERAEMGQYATLRVVERFLPVFDNFNVAMSHMPQSEDKAVVNWAVGVGFIQKQLEQALRDLGLTPIKTEGQKFDASKHEAVGEEESDKEHGTILKEVQTGYEILGKTVRPSKVIIAK